MDASIQSLTTQSRTGQHDCTALVTSKAIVPIGNKGFFMPGLQANYSTSVGSERNTTGIRPEYSRRLWTVTSSRRPSFEGRQPLVKVQVMNKHVTGASAEITFRYITLDSAVKRVRRHLAKSGASLIKSKPGTKAWRELGDFSIRDASGEVLMKSVNLRSLMEAAEILADDEMIELPGFSGWRWYVARQTAVKNGGQTVLCNEPLTRVYFTEKQARRAAESIADKSGLVICSFDASGRSGGRDE